MKKIMNMFSNNKNEQRLDNEGEKKVKLFIVDDNELEAELIEKNLLFRQNNKLTPLSFDIELFPNGEECLYNIYKEPDIIILDYYLGSQSDDDAFNGDKVYKEIVRLIPSQSVIVLSGQQEGKIVHELIRIGVRHYIIKDDEMFDNLINLIEEIMQ